MNECPHFCDCDHCLNGDPPKSRAELRRVRTELVEICKAHAPSAVTQAEAHLAAVQGDEP